MVNRMTSDHSMYGMYGTRFLALLLLLAAGTDGTGKDPLVGLTVLCGLLGLDRIRCRASLLVEPDRGRIGSRVLVSAEAHVALFVCRLEPERQLILGRIGVGTGLQVKVQRVWTMVKTPSAGHIHHVAKVYAHLALCDRLALHVAGGRRMALFELEAHVCVPRRHGAQQAGLLADLYAVQRAAVRALLVVKFVWRAKDGAWCLAAGGEGRGMGQAGKGQGGNEGEGEGEEACHVAGEWDLSRIEGGSDRWAKGESLNQLVRSLIYPFRFGFIMIECESAVGTDTGNASPSRQTCTYIQRRTNPLTVVYQSQTDGSWQVDCIDLPTS